MAGEQGRYKETFLLFDRAGNEKITSSDVGPAMRACGYAPTEGELATMKQSIDPEGKEESNVDFATFLSLIGKLRPRGTETDWREGLSVFDKEGDGLISATDFRYVLTNLGEAMTDGEADEILRRVKIESDGNFKYEEFVQLMGS